MTKSELKAAKEKYFQKSKLIREITSEKLIKETNSLLSKVLNKLGLQAKNMSFKTQDGGELVLEKESGQPAVGDAAAPDGVSTLEDGTVVTVSDGVITEVVPAGNDPEEEVEALKQKIADLEAENESLKSAKVDLDEKKAEAETLIGELKAIRDKWKPAARTNNTEKVKDADPVVVTKETIKNVLNKINGKKE